MKQHVCVYRAENKFRRLQPGQDTGRTGHEDGFALQVAGDKGLAGDVASLP